MTEPNTETCPKCGSELIAERLLNGWPLGKFWKVYCPEGCVIDVADVDPTKCVCQ